MGATPILTLTPAWFLLYSFPCQSLFVSQRLLGVSRYGVHDRANLYPGYILCDVRPFLFWDRISRISSLLNPYVGWVYISAVHDSMSHSILFFTPIYFWFWKRKYFLIHSTFFEATSTRYSFILSTLIIQVPSTKFSIPLREFYSTAFPARSYNTSYKLYIVK